MAKPSSSFLSLIFPNSLLLLLATLIPFTNLALISAQPSPVPFSECFSGNASQKLHVDTIYAQLTGHPELGDTLNLTVVGNSPLDIVGYSNESSSLATLFVSTSLLTLNVWENSSYFCATLRPPSPLPALDPTTQTYCPIPAGPFAFSAGVPWGKGRALTTLNTRLRAVDPFGAELVCLDVGTTPLNPGPLGSPYGKAVYIFWASVALAIGYWVVVGLARIVSAWNRGISKPGSSLWAKVESSGFILASAISGERLATSPALMRFCTPSMRDIFFHSQWCSALTMVAVQWPNFIYPLLTQTAWSTLSYNITTVSGSESRHWNPLYTPSFNPPSNFAPQLADSGSPLFIDSKIPNTLFTLPSNATDGMTSFAFTVGVRPEDLFGICMVLFLSIIAATIIGSSLVWFVDHLVTAVIGVVRSGNSQSGLGLGQTGMSGRRSPGILFPTKDGPEGLGIPGLDESRSLNGHKMFRAPSRLTLTLSNRKWWKIRPDINSFHGSVLHGNLVRVLVLFHLPVTIFSCYQMTLSRSHASLASIVLAALSYLVFSILLPVFLVVRMTITSTNKLYEETRTLLSFGPLYNHYRHGSQLFASLLFATNVGFGTVIGCGQRSGTAQAVVILIIEVISALVTSIWLPWAHGAGMGLISFLFCVARIVIAVLLVILTPAISIGAGAGGWVAYAILAILALVYLAFTIILIVKLIEAATRIIGRVGFDRSNHVVDAGLLGACGLLGCFGSRRRRKPRNQTRRQYRATEAMSRDLPASEVSSYAAPVLLTGSRKESTHSGPPSVLKPEHALRPYREDSDDENGYIMGAWQPFPRAGYSSVDPSSSMPPTPTLGGTVRGGSNNSPHGSGSGFSRVGGGRAHFDSPYAIAGGSTQTFPSLADKERGSLSALAPAVFDDDDSPPPSVVNVPRHNQSLVNLGGDGRPMRGEPVRVLHTRTVSQSAIVENASPGLLSPPSAILGSIGKKSGRRSSVDPSQTRPAMFGTGGDDSDSDGEFGVDGNASGGERSSGKKRSWFHLRRNRVHSEGEHPTLSSNRAEGSSSSASVTGQGQASGEEPQPGPGRSFVVIRDRKPPGTTTTAQSQSPSAWMGDPSGEGAGQRRERPRSFGAARLGSS